jgi:hypothetical protein
MISDSDGELTFGPMGQKVWDLYAKIREVFDIEMMEFTEDELRVVSMLYGENLVYPVYNHVNQLLTGTPEEETLH